MTNIAWQLFEAGHCVHPEASSRIGASWRRCEFPALVALLRHPTLGWMLFDTGYGQAFADATRGFPEAIYTKVTPVSWHPRQSMIAQLHAKGIEAGDIRHVLVSHFHGDHVGGLADFPAARVWCAHEAWEDLHRRSRLSALAKGLLPALAPRAMADRLRFYERMPRVRLPAELAPFHAAFDLFEDGSIYAVSLPGHAAGHFGVCFRAQGRWVFLVADAAWSVRAIEENTPPPRWTTALLGETAQYRDTLARLHDLASRRTGVTLVPAHCRTYRP
jgi:glyoxylase-like metal-dependent hydrolase (beta-lactamase superfamily II)